MTIASIAKEAGVSVGYFYNFFTSKESFAVAMIDELENVLLLILWKRLINKVLFRLGNSLTGIGIIVHHLCGIFTVTVALAIHIWSATLSWFTTYLKPRIGAESAIEAVTAYRDDTLIAIMPMYIPMVLVIGIHFVMLLAGKTRYPRWMLVFHPVTINILLVVIPDIAQAMQVPVATWMSVMSQSSTNSSIVIWCIAAAVYGKKQLGKND